MVIKQMRFVPQVD
ncbi:Protein of unknown function [Leuconostoc citreum]|nr:Protein of unknown function [Leuconostoc citreum LBAE C10]CCF26555.1 Protein of unknown function [Leuconostoc citreum LBAE C11]CCF29063.1 Protein of unknown function [Leuconostoc citreum LBAE E16]CDX65488.1 Protein of unknown function [Leuconostoc citreum]CDX67258.1 Protein of unknown function [Leuconostoc citreum]